MARYIDADRMKEKLYKEMKDSAVALLMGQLLSEQPTADVVEVVRCKDCIHSEELAKHCEINRNAYRHCKLWRGEETKNVWHKYIKHYKDYSIVSVDGFCDDGERK